MRLCGNTPILRCEHLAYSNYPIVTCWIDHLNRVDALSLIVSGEIGLVSFHQCRNIGTSLGAADRMALGQGSVRPRVSEGRRARKTRSEPGQSPGPRSCEPASRKEGRGLNGGVERWPGRKCSWEST